MTDDYSPSEDARKSYDVAIEAKRLRGDTHWPAPAWSDAVAFDLPWPSRTLHPNARVHWAQKAKAARRARQDAALLARQAGLKEIPTTRLRVTAYFMPPNNHRRDEDGMLSNIKSYLDGLADVIGVDDSHWKIEIRRMPAVKGGNVRLLLEIQT